MTPTLSTSALVLHTTEYSESSVIAKLFTRQLGVRSYIIKGVRKSGSRTKQNLLQPLSHLDLVVYNNPKNQINYIKEIGPHLAHTPQSDNLFPASYMAIHNALRFFMTEVLYKTLREEEPMPELFDYVADSSQPGEESAQLAQRPILTITALSPTSRTPRKPPSDVDSDTADRTHQPTTRILPTPPCRIPQLQIT